MKYLLVLLSISVAVSCCGQNNAPYHDHQPPEYYDTIPALVLCSDTSMREADNHYISKGIIVTAKKIFAVRRHFYYSGEYPSKLDGIMTNYTEYLDEKKNKLSDKIVVWDIKTNQN